MFCWTLKLEEVLNKQILSASVPEAAVGISNSHSLEYIWVKRTRMDSMQNSVTSFLPSEPKYAN